VFMKKCNTRRRKAQVSLLNKIG